jgi:hypothetical protein
VPDSLMDDQTGCPTPGWGPDVRPSPRFGPHIGMTTVAAPLFPIGEPPDTQDGKRDRETHPAVGRQRWKPCPCEAALDNFVTQASIDASTAS